MLEKYRANFAALTAEAEALVASALLRRYPNVPTEGPLFERCSAAGLDQADVVMSLAADPSPLAVAALETVMGKPMIVGHPCLSGPPPAPAPDAPPQVEPREKRTRAPRAPKSDPRVVVDVAPNPKKPGSQSHERYAIWRVGMTVSEALAAGLTGADVKWDTERGYVKLGDLA